MFLQGMAIVPERGAFIMSFLIMCTISCRCKRVMKRRARVQMLVAGQRECF